MVAKKERLKQAARRQREYKERQKNEGLVAVRVWVPGQTVPDIVDLAKVLRRGARVVY